MATPKQVAKHKMLCSRISPLVGELKYLPTSVKYHPNFVVQLAGFHTARSFICRRLYASFWSVPDSGLGTAMTICHILDVR